MEQEQMTPEQKAWIDRVHYYELLLHWRMSPAGDLLFRGETGDYYAKVMAEKKSQLAHEEQVDTSKRIG